jgi:hypothetical protein
MRLSLSLLLLAIAGVAHAASHSVEGYIFTASKPQLSESLDLTPEEVRLVLAQQLDITQYHSLVNPDTPVSSHDIYDKLKYLNTLGGRQHGLFDDDVAESSSPRRLVIWVPAFPEQIANLKAEWSSRGWESPSFRMQGHPSNAGADMLVKDMQMQVLRSSVPTKGPCGLEQLLDLSDECWRSKSSHIMTDYYAQGV